MWQPVLKNCCGSLLHAVAAVTAYLQMLHAPSSLQADLQEFPTINNIYAKVQDPLKEQHRIAFSQEILGKDRGWLSNLEY